MNVWSLLCETNLLLESFKKLLASTYLDKQFSHIFVTALVVAKNIGSIFTVLNINGNIVQLATAPAAQQVPQAAPVTSPTPASVPVQQMAGVNGNNIVMVIYR